MPVTTRRAAANRRRSTGWSSPQALNKTITSKSKTPANDKVKKAKRPTKSAYLQPESPSRTPIHATDHSLSSDESDGPALARDAVYRPRNSTFQPPSQEYQPRSPSLFNSQPQPQASVSPYRTARSIETMGPQSTRSSLGQVPRMIPTNTAVRFVRPSVSSGESFERRLSQAAFGRAAFSTHRLERLPTNSPVNRVRHSSSISPGALRPSTRSPSTEPQVPRYGYTDIRASAPLGRRLSQWSPYSDLYWQPQNRIRQPSAAVSSPATITTPGTPSELDAASPKRNRRVVSYTPTVKEAASIVKRQNSIQAGLKHLSNTLGQAAHRIRHLEELVNETDEILDWNAARPGVMHDRHNRKRHRRQRKALKPSNNKLESMAV